MLRGLRLLGLSVALVSCGSRTGLSDDLDASAPTLDVLATTDLPRADSTPVFDLPAVDLGDEGHDVAAIPDAPTIDLAPPQDVAVDLPVAEVAPLPVCGDGRRDLGEECDLGLANVDAWAFTVQQVGRPAVPVAPLARGASAVLFYDYRSASAHTGFEAVGVAQLILQVAPATDTLGLVFIAGLDASEGSPPSQPDSRMRLTFTGVPDGARLAVSDDADEFVGTAVGMFSGRWSFSQNTDGGAFDRLSWDLPWRIVVTPTWLGGVSAFRFVHASGVVVPLALRDALVIEHRVRPSACRRDCTVPRCGDGRLDPGERCDGASCSPDCRDIR